jgi:hypothetical protein
MIGPDVVMTNRQYPCYISQARREPSSETARGLRFLKTPLQTFQGGGALQIDRASGYPRPVEARHKAIRYFRNEYNRTSTHSTWPDSRSGPVPGQRMPRATQSL